MSNRSEAGVTDRRPKNSFGRAPNCDESAPARRRDPASDKIASSSPLGAIALFLLARWKHEQGRGLVFISEDDRRAEQLGAILYAFDPVCGVMVLPQMDTLPYDGMEPSASIMCRRASV
ncbi:MAG TPA: transcription-repair coupling factor, partial [Roseiarcus sp.]